MQQKADWIAKGGRDGKGKKGKKGKKGGKGEGGDKGKQEEAAANLNDVGGGLAEDGPV